LHTSEAALFDDDDVVCGLDGRPEARPPNDFVEQAGITARLKRPKTSVGDAVLEALSAGGCREHIPFDVTVWARILTAASIRSSQGCLNCLLRCYCAKISQQSESLVIVGCALSPFMTTFTAFLFASDDF
jgi:hypothetical protein